MRTDASREAPSASEEVCIASSEASSASRVHIVASCEAVDARNRRKTPLFGVPGGLRALPLPQILRRMTKTHDDILEMPIAELEKRVAKAKEHLAAIDELLPGLVGLTPEARKHSNGKFRTGEPEALGSVLAAAKKKPQLFESLAAMDHGYDAKKFEVDVIKDRLARVEVLAELATALDETSQSVADTTLHLGELARPVMLSAYAIAKSVSVTDGAVADAIRPALDFYARVGRASAATRRSKTPAAKP